MAMKDNKDYYLLYHDNGMQVYLKFEYNNQGWVGVSMN